MNGTLAHRHGPFTHRHHHHGPHRHARLLFRSAESHDQEAQSHSHGVVDPTIVRSRAGVQAVAWSLAILAATAGLQAVVFLFSGSVALLSDLIHNVGDALTAVPLGIAFLTRSRRGERVAGYVIVLTIVLSACIAAYEAVDRLLHPRSVDYLGALAAAGILGFVGNEIAARVRLAAGHRLDSAALVADGHHARVDGFVSLGVVLAAAAVALGIPRADPVVGLAIVVIIMRVTWQAWHTIRVGRSD